MELNISALKDTVEVSHKSSKDDTCVVNEKFLNIILEWLTLLVFAYCQVDTK